MNTSDPTKLTGRGRNDDKMRSTRHDISRPFTTRAAGNGLSKTETGRTRINWTEKYYTGNGHTI